MKLKVYLGVCAILLSSIALLAQNQTKKEMSADEKAAMEAMMKAGTPGEAHKQLAPLVGTWNVVVKMFPQPGAPAQESKGTAVNKWVLGGRWVQENFTGKFMNMPFTGIGYTGYDNIKKQYTGTWMDNMSTATMVSSPRLATYSNDSSADSTLPSGTGPGTMATGVKVGSFGLILVTVFDSRLSA